MAGSAFGFRRLTPLLTAEGFQVIVVEPLGIGRSGRPREADYSLTAQAVRVAAVLDTLELRRVTVVAHSLGASIAYRLAVERPDLVAGILSIEGGPAEAAATRGFRRAMRFAPLFRVIGGEALVRSKLSRDLRASSGDESWVTDAVVEGYAADALRDFNASLDAFVGMAESQEPWALAPVLRDIHCPVRLVLGTARHRGAVPPEQITLLADSLPAFAIDSVSGAGHFVFEEQPSAVAEALERLQLQQTVAQAGPPQAEEGITP
jgi:pimeloyl-ACP methyl ester carboxylesterase